MRIGYFADGPWAHQALNLLVARATLSIAFIVARDDHPDPVLRERAARLNVPFLTHPDVNSQEFLDVIQQHRADLFVSMSFNQILKTAILKMAPKGFINCHAGALPFYRGRNVLNWALINGADRFGVTVHHIDGGIDTGDILLQRFCTISPTDTYADVLRAAYALCAESLLEAVLALEQGSVQYKPQRALHSVGTYFPQRRDGDEWIDWTWSSRRIFNLIRAISPPGPGARTAQGNERFCVLAAEMVEDAPVYVGPEGAVVGRDDRGIIVKTGDTTLRLTQMGMLDAQGLPANATIPRHRIGTRFINHLELRVRLLEQKI